MNILSLMSFSVFVLFVLLGCYSLILNRNSTFNIFAFIECIILSIWAFAYTFFYIAPSPTDAMFWHKIGCIGGSLFPPFAIYFFLILTNRNRYFKHLWQYLLFYTGPLIILAKNLISETTVLALDVVQSTSGLGWTYVNSATNIWTWIYLLYLGTYFGVGFYLLFLWREESQYKTQKRQALIIIVVDIIVLIMGLTTDVFMPLFTHFLPPMANISTILFAIGFFILISQYQLFSFSKMASPDIILDTVMEKLFIPLSRRQSLKTVLMGLWGLWSHFMILPPEKKPKKRC